MNIPKNNFIYPCFQDAKNLLLKNTKKFAVENPKMHHLADYISSNTLTSALNGNELTLD